jgi:hypothetical protein
MCEAPVNCRLPNADCELKNYFPSPIANPKSAFRNWAGRLRRRGWVFAFLDHTRKSRDTAGSGIGMQDALATSLLDGAGSRAQLGLRRNRIATGGRREDFFQEGFNPRLHRLITVVPFQILFMSFLF